MASTDESQPGYVDTIYKFGESEIKDEGKVREWFKSWVNLAVNNPKDQESYTILELDSIPTFTSDLPFTKAFEKEKLKKEEFILMFLFPKKSKKYHTMQEIIEPDFIKNNKPSIPETYVARTIDFFQSHFVNTVSSNTDDAKSIQYIVRNYPSISILYQPNAKKGKKRSNPSFCTQIPR